MKFLLIIAVVALIFFFIGRARSGTDKSAQQAKAAPASEQDAERMVQCKVCAVHLPASEAVIAATGEYFCSQAHARLRDEA